MIGPAICAQLVITALNALNRVLDSVEIPFLALQALIEIKLVPSAKSNAGLAHKVTTVKRAQPTLNPATLGTIARKDHSSKTHANPASTVLLSLLKCFLALRVTTAPPTEPIFTQSA